MYVCMYMVCTCMGVCSCEFMGWVTCCCDPDPFGKIRTRYGRFRVVPVMDQISKQFEDQSMRWSGDPHRLVQWRSDDDLVPKPHHFKSVFVYWSISISAIYLIISCEYLYFSALYCSWSCSLSWYLYQSSKAWDWKVFDMLSIGFWS